MSMRTLCAQLFGAVALVAALLVLPQAAHAHPGHAHAFHVHAQHQQADVAALADGAADQQAVPSLTATGHDLPGTGSGSSCPDRGCCAQASCAACFSIVAPMPPQVAPPSLGTMIVLSVIPLPSGVGGPSLRRPPRSFA